MGNKALGLVLLGISVIIIGGFGIWKLTSDKNDSAPTKTTPQSQPANSESNLSEAPVEASFSADEVAQHNTSEDCWTIIDNKVYDLTSFIDTHPGGDEILRACGKDGSSLFNSRETSSGETVGSGNPHSSSAASQLANLQVGTLKQ